MTDYIKVPKDTFDKIIDEVHSLREEITEYRAENERDKATIRQEVTEVKNQETDSEGSQGGSEADKLPIENLEEIGKVSKVTESVERAGVIFENWSNWSDKAPAGRTIKKGLKKLVETATGEKLYWTQIKRACLKLMKWSKGAIQFKNTNKHGWMLVQERSLSVTKG